MLAEVNVVRTALSTRYYNDKPIMIMALDDAVEALADSAWCVKQVIRDLILKKLEAGESLTLERDGRPWIQYRMAKQGEVVQLIDTGAVTGVHKMNTGGRRRGKDYQFMFTIPKGDELALMLRGKDSPPLTKQQRIMLKAVAEAGHETLGADGLAQVLEITREELKLDKDRDLVGIFRGHCKWAYTKLGLVRIVGDEDKSEEGEETEDEPPAE